MLNVKLFWVFRLCKFFTEFRELYLNFIFFVISIAYYSILLSHSKDLAKPFLENAYTDHRKDFQPGGNLRSSPSKHLNRKVFANLTDSH